MKKSVIISLALVLALAVSGFTYALWGGNMFINGSVGTGTYDVWCFWENNNDPGTTVDPGKTMHVGTTETSMQADDNGKLTIGNVTVTNAYPGYTSTGQFCVHNRGSIPVKVMSVNVTNPNAADVLSVTTSPSMVGLVLQPNEYQFIDITNLVGDNAAQAATYNYSVAILTQQAQ